MKLLKQCTLDGVTRRKDKSLKISFITSLEQSSTELMEVDKLLDSNGILYFKDSEGLSTDEINQIDKVVLDKPKGKTKKSERKVKRRKKCIGEVYSTYLYCRSSNRR